MPTTYTHYKFGREVLKALPDPIARVAGTYRQLYDIGQHGPDILFYYIRTLHKCSVNDQGYNMHREMADEFFNHGLEVVKQEKNHTAARAYMYGFICHFALDSECHPYVEKMIQESGVTHNEIEMELDRYLMVQDGLDPVTYLRTPHIYPTMRNAKVIAPFFKDLTPSQVQGALRGMISSHKLFISPGQTKRNIIFAIMRLARQYDHLHGVIVSLTPNPVCEEYNQILMQQFEKAVPLAVELIEDFIYSLVDGRPLPERFHRTFGAGENWEELSLEL